MPHYGNMPRRITQIRLYVSDKRVLNKFRLRGETQQEMMKRVAKIIKNRGGT